ncbi:MAG TPA: hypothetical protein VHV28_12880, partial [Solirubrobacteraceae bacterium]|nr:hypothetical protein [Solirubrobacteraceae bacterium]
MAPHSRSPVPVLAAQIALTGGLALGAIATSWVNRPTWAWSLCLVVAVFVILADLAPVPTGPALTVSGSFLALVVSAVILGPGPAGAIGAATTVFLWAHHRTQLHYLVNNLVNFAAFPLAAGIFFHVVTSATGLGTADAGYYLLVFAAFVVALALNFLFSAGYMCWLDGASLTHKVRESLMPLLSAELFSALLAVAATYLTARLGVTGFILFGLVL